MKGIDVIDVDMDKIRSQIGAIKGIWGNKTQSDYEYNN